MFSTLFLKCISFAIYVIAVFWFNIFYLIFYCISSLLVLYCVKGYFNISLSTIFGDVLISRNICYRSITVLVKMQEKHLTTTAVLYFYFTCSILR